MNKEGIRMELKEKIDEVLENVKVGKELEDSIMKKTVRKESKNFGRHVLRKRLAISMCMAVLITSSVFVVAAKFPHFWNETVAKLFQADNNQQNKLVEQGYANVLSKAPAENKEAKENTDSKNNLLIAESNGVTVTATQTLADKYGIYVYLNVKANNGIKLNSDQVFDIWDITVDNDKGFFNNMTAGFVTDEESISDSERGYEIWLANTTGEPMTGKTLNIHLENLLQADKKQGDYVLVEGVWDFKWNITNSTASKVIELNDTIVADDVKLLLDSVELSPLSYYVHYTSDGEGTTSEDFMGAEVSFIMKDGRIYNGENGKDEDIITGGPGMIGADGTLRIFDKVLDLDQLEAIKINGKEYKIK